MATLTLTLPTERRSFPLLILIRFLLVPLCNLSRWGDLLEKRGARIVYLALKQEGEIQVAALVYSLPMLGGLHMELNSGPIYTKKEALPIFYAELKAYAKQNGVLELLVKPYETYQTFDSEGNPIDAEKKSIIQDLTNLGYQFDGLTTGYPGGEPDWLYYKDLTELTEKNLLKSFSKRVNPW